MSATVAVLGASGFTGGELIRLLSGHPELSLTVAGSRSQAGSSVGELHDHLGELAVPVVTQEDAIGAEVDVCFSCLPGAQLPALIRDAAAPLIVDLADDFRSTAPWVYGLPEYARDRLDGATRVANPGCYPTASLLGLVPFARAGAIGEDIVIDALSGYSGAGRKALDRLSLAEGAGTVAAYGTTEHRHVAEIERGLAAFGFLDAKVSFTPHLVPMPRGLLVTARARPRRRLNDTDVLGILFDAYAKEPFVDVVEDWPTTKAVAGSNRALVSARVDHRADWVVVSAAIDNLGKGAAGQAIQNANIALGLDEWAGLTTRGVWP